MLMSPRAIATALWERYLLQTYFYRFMCFIQGVKSEVAPRKPKGRGRGRPLMQPPSHSPSLSLGRGCLFLNWLQTVKCAPLRLTHFTACSQFRNKHPLQYLSSMTVLAIPLITSPNSIRFSFSTTTPSTCPTSSS